jgi:hypothetical protein
VLTTRPQLSVTCSYRTQNYHFHKHTTLASILSVQYSLHSHNLFLRNSAWIELLHFVDQCVTRESWITLSCHWVALWNSPNEHLNKHFWINLQGRFHCRWNFRIWSINGRVTSKCSLFLLLDDTETTGRRTELRKVQKENRIQKNGGGGIITLTAEADKYLYVHGSKRTVFREWLCYFRTASSVQSDFSWLYSDPLVFQHACTARPAIVFQLAFTQWVFIVMENRRCPARKWRQLCHIRQRYRRFCN